MKAIILEVKGGYAAALREDGLIVKTRQLGEVGTTVELNEKIVPFPSQKKRVLRTAVAAALVLAVTGGTYTYTNVVAASYVTLDTEETSVELSVNRMGRVVGVRALDEDSSLLAESLAADVRRMKVEDAVDAAMSRMGHAPTVVAGVTGDTEKHSADLQEAVRRGAARTERGDMELVTLEISRDERREADERDMSSGRWAFERGGGRWREEPDAPGDFDDREDGDNRPAPQDDVGRQVPSDQDTQSTERNNNQTALDSNRLQMPENSGIQPTDGAPNDGQTIQKMPANGQIPPDNGLFGFAPDGGVQSPQNGMPPQGGMGGPGGMPGSGAPQR